MEPETTETVATDTTDAAATDTTNDAEATDDVNDQEPEADPAAGLKTALQKERAARKAEAKRVKELEQELADRDKPDDEKAIDVARREAAAEATAKANTRLVAAEFRIAAAKRVKDPRIAAKLVDLSDVEVNEDGEVDSEGITNALDALLDEYPDLAPSRFEGTADQGGKGKDSKPSQLSRDDLKTMTPAAILAAEKAGQLDRIKGKIK